MKKRGLKISLTLVAVLSTVAQVFAMPLYFKKPNTEKNVLKTTAGCHPATAAIDLDINNIRARLMTGGDMWWNQGTNTAAYEVPKGSHKHSLFAGSCWIGGIDGNGNLKVAAQTYRQDGNDYWPGPLDPTTHNITESSCSNWDRQWKINKSVVNEFLALMKSGPDAVTDPKFDDIKTWPGVGNVYAVGASGDALPELQAPADDYGYAPFVDVSGPAGKPDGKYNWKDGDYPRSYGVDGANPDQFIWWVFNDMGNAKLQTKTEGIGMEVQTSAFAYSRGDFMNDATFYNYRLINRGNTVLDSCFIATWTDADLGNPNDDYIGCDTNRGLGILYNANSFDMPNGENCYGTRLPMIGVDFFIGPRKDYVSPYTGKDTSRLLKMATFSYYERTTSGALREPNNGPSFYNYMTGATYDGIRFSNDQSLGPQSKGYGTGPIAPYVFYGDPQVKTEWSQCACNSPMADRRFLHSSGPFTLKEGVKNDITIGVVWVDNVGGCTSGGSFKKIRAADDIAQGLFDVGFKATVGPEAPTLSIREMDRKLIVYITNPENSNNYQERYGDPAWISDDRYRVVSTKAASLHAPDSLYRFEGYRVFQLKKATSSLYDENGNINTSEVVEVFQCDKKNGITQIVNFSKNLDVSDTITYYNAIVKVKGTDQGLKHSFVLTEDAFATDEKVMVNYKTYYFKAIAYAFNNFAGFDPKDETNTQDEAYLPGDNAAGGSTIPVYSAMPNPMNQNGDTTSNSVYGDGVVITRIEGTGNGGLDLQLSDTSEFKALQGPNFQEPFPSYAKGRGPVDIKVIDPKKVVAADWTIFMTGTNKHDQLDSVSANMGMQDTSKWTIIKHGENGAPDVTIYSERSISTYNEQILADYGLSVAATQVLPPGLNQLNTNNGYITSDVTYADKTQQWLAGIPDASGRSFNNWIRGGLFVDKLDGAETAPACFPYNDKPERNSTDPKVAPNAFWDSAASYSNMFASNSYIVASWTPYDLAASTGINSSCGFAPAFDVGVGSGAKDNTQATLWVNNTGKVTAPYSELPNIDLVFTSDKSKWTRCAVLEIQETQALAENKGMRVHPRSHRSWNLEVDADGKPVYATNPTDTGFSYFPGYAINQTTGERVNIMFGEDSYLKQYNGGDMIWNPTGDAYNEFGDVIFGGRHYIYITNTKYDSCNTFVRLTAKLGMTGDQQLSSIPALRAIRWVGVPILNSGMKLLSLKDGLIPTETRLRFRVNTPYKQYKLMTGQTAVNGQFPMYNFTTKGMAPVDWKQVTDGKTLLDRVAVVPNPYKGQASGGNTYETSRLSTVVKIINLPQKASVNIYSLDGTLIRHLEKDNNDPALSWDLFNQAGLPIASGMYLIHVNAYGENVVLRWFGAMRPLDVTNY